MVYRVLSIDGGGIRGVFALKLLEFIQDEVDKDFLKKIDCFAGTSTGGLISTCLNLGHSPKKLLFYYKNLGSFAFAKNTKGSSKYHNKRLKFLLKTIVPKNLTLNDLDRDLIIPTCRLYDPSRGRWKEEIYDTFTNGGDRVIDVAIRSASAPLYFPSYQGHIDGGVFAVNPALIAYSRLIDQNGGKKDSHSIRLLSLGNGVNPSGIEGEVDWGVDDWMDDKLKLFELMTDMSMQVPHYPLQQILKDQYHRINSILKEEVALDEAKKVNSLLSSADLFKKEHNDIWLKDKDWLINKYLDTG
ncbi:MAG: putative sporulation hydrolase CotR [Chlamydiia bacterium]|nr:putative sporulation hydrolase CotR [Chlamydiia bacterium]